MMIIKSIFFILFILNLINAQTNSFFHLSDVHFSSVINSQIYNQSTLCIPPSLYEKMKHQEVDNHHEIMGKSKNSIFNNTASGLYGRYGCDTNLNLLDSTFQQMVSVNQNPDFIIYTGDSVGHSLPQSSWQDSQNLFVKTIQSYFSPQSSTVFIPTIGNNDVFPDYNSQCSDSNLQFLADLWSEWIPSDQVSNFSKSGSLVFEPVQGLLVISLNTVLYSVKNQNTFSTPSDPCGQFAWLQNQLEYAQANRLQVYITGHIFPGLDPFYLQSTWKTQYITSFFEVLTNYEEILSASFFGHIHRDEFRSVIISNFTSTYFPMFIGSSITPVYVNNPSVKLFSYNPQSLNVTDFSTFYSDIYISNILGKMNWNLEYTFLNSYIESEQGINGNTINQLIQLMQTNDEVYNSYDDHRTSNYLADVVVNLCLANALTTDSLNDCYNSFTALA